jgi:hypothetical protein
LRFSLPQQYSNALPRPYQAGRVWRDWAQPNSQAIARTDDFERSPFARCDGREPMLSRPISLTGVAS